MPAIVFCRFRVRSAARTLTLLPPQARGQTSGSGNAFGTPPYLGQWTGHAKLYRLWARQIESIRLSSFVATAIIHDHDQDFGILGQHFGDILVL